MTSKEPPAGISILTGSSKRGSRGRTSRYYIAKYVQGRSAESLCMEYQIHARYNSERFLYAGYSNKPRWFEIRPHRERRCGIRSDERE